MLGNVLFWIKWNFLECFVQPKTDVVFFSFWQENIKYACCRLSQDCPSQHQIKILLLKYGSSIRSILYVCLNQCHIYHNGQQPILWERA